MMCVCLVFVIVVVVVFVFNFQNGERAGLNFHLDLAPLCIGAVKLVAPVIDLDPPDRPFICDRELHDGVAWLPLGHGHGTFYFGLCHACAQEAYKEERGGNWFHGRGSGSCVHGHLMQGETDSTLKQNKKVLQDAVSFVR